MNRFPALVLISTFACGCGASQQRAHADRQALREELDAVTKRLDRAEQDRAANAQRLSRLEQAIAVLNEPAPPPPPPPTKPPTLDVIGADALTTCRSLQKAQAISGCSAYKPQGLAWKGATTTARFVDPKADKACGAEDVCMIVLYADEGAYRETKKAVQSVEGLPIYFNDRDRVVLKVDARISKQALERLTELLRVAKVSSPSGL